MQLDCLDTQSQARTRGSGTITSYDPSEYGDTFTVEWSEELASPDAVREFVRPS